MSLNSIENDIINAMFAQVLRLKGWQDRIHEINNTETN